MKRLMKLTVPLFVCAAMAVLAIAAAGSTVRAATPNYSVAVPGVQIVPLHLGGQYTATTTGVVRFKLPFSAHLVGVSASARASGGTSPTLAVDVKAGGTSVLSDPVSVTAGSVAEAGIATAALADETVVTVDLTIGGTNPTWDDVVVLLTIVRN